MATQEFTIENLLSALTQLPEYGGYEALAGGLGETYPGATFSPAHAGSYGQGFLARDWEPAVSQQPNAVPGFVGQNFNLGEAAVRAGFAGGDTPIGNWPAAYEAMWPTLTSIVPEESWYTPSRGIGKMGGEVKKPHGDGQRGEQDVAAGAAGTTTGTAAQPAASTTDARTEASFPKTPQGYEDFVQWIITTGIPNAEMVRRTQAFNKAVWPVVSGTQTNVATGETADAGNAAVGDVGDADRTVEKNFTPPVGAGNAAIKAGLDGDLDPESGFVPDVGTTVTEPVTKPVRDYTPIGSEGPETSEVLPHKPGSKIPHSPDLDKDTTPDITEPGSDDINITESSTDIDTEYRDKYPPGVSAGPAPKKGLGIIPSDDRQQKETNEITKGMSGNQKAEVGNITNQAINYLKSTGWADSGEWGYARTRNMLTGGGQGQVVTQGPLVPWKSMGRDASSTDYISNVGGQDYLPSRLAPGERLGETTTTGELGYVPEGRREGWDQPIDTGGSLLPVDNTSIVDAYNNLPDDIKLDLPSVKENDLARAQTYINTLRNSNITKDTFKDAKTVDDVGNTLGGFLSDVAGGVKGLGSKITEGIKTLTGMTDEDVAGKNFYQIMNTNIPLFETEGGSGITPLDIIMLASGGLAALPLVAVNKFGLSMLAPIKNAVQGGIKGVFDLVLGKTDKLLNTKGSELSQEDINAYELAGLVNSFGIDKPAGTINKGVYYDSSGKALSDNMQRLNFNMNAKGSVEEFTNAVIGIAENVDPFYKDVFWMPDTGEVLIERNDGTWVRKAGYVPIDSDGNIYKGDPKVARKDMTSFDPKGWFHLDQSTFDEFAGVSGLDPSYGAESNMMDILREWERQRREPENL